MHRDTAFLLWNNHLMTSYSKCFNVIINSSYTLLRSEELTGSLMISILEHGAFQSRVYKIANVREFIDIGLVHD